MQGPLGPGSLQVEGRHERPHKAQGDPAQRGRQGEDRYRDGRGNSGLGEGTGGAELSVQLHYDSTVNGHEMAASH